MKKHWASWLGLLLCCGSVAVQANQAGWQDRSAKSADGQAVVATPLQRYRLLALDETALQQQLAMPVLEGAGQQARLPLPSLSLPLPDGGFAVVQAERLEILSPEVAARFPTWGTWKVHGTDGKVLSGVVGITALGFHAMLDMANGDTVFIEPQQGTDGERHYLSFRKSANRAAFQQAGWQCQQHATGTGTAPRFAPATASSNMAARSTAAKMGETLHTYRIAIAATGEYTQFWGGQAEAFASIKTLVDRLNQVYGRDLSIRLQLVSDERVVYPNPFTDPYNNSSASALLVQNPQNLNSMVGTGNYDIGHVLATANGGLASVASVCSSAKAEGMSGFSRPQGDAFIIDFVAHEIGHQLGATHTFNSELGGCAGGNREPFTAYEPGSGSSIMGYAGLCSSDNLQVNSDSTFHIMSILQIEDFMHNGAGAVCAQRSSLGNRNPSVNAGADYVIPAGTPFTLRGSASDPDGNPLGYAWEQIDAGTASRVNVDTGNNALIRSRLPAATAERTVPPLADLVNLTQTAGETLPSTNRQMNFRLSARDGRGGIGYDDMRLTVVNTGSAFAVTHPTSTVLLPGSALHVTWNVAETNQPPINCTAVDIAVTDNGGQTFQPLLSRTPNTGSALVTLPLGLGVSSRIRVQCSDNIFFALSATTPARASVGTGTISATGTATTMLTSSGGSGGGGGSIPSWAWLLLAGGVLWRLWRKPRRLL